MDEFEDISHLNPENARTVEYREPSRTVTYRNAAVDGRWTRVRIDGPRTLENVEAAVGRAAARSVGRRAEHVVTVRPDGWRPGFVRLFAVTVATGPRRHGVAPVVTVNVNLELQPELV